MLITLKDGSSREFEAGSSVLDIVKAISGGLARAAVAAVVNGETVDLATTLQGDATLEVLTFESEEGKRVFRHTASHILAQAVKRL